MAFPAAPLRATLGAPERLKRTADIDALFLQGKAHSCFPLRLLYRVLPAATASEVPLKAGFSAPKKKFKRAHDRNRIKRLLREAWRLAKPYFLPRLPAGIRLHLFIVFTGKELPTFKEVDAALQKGLKKILGDLLPTPK